MVNEEKENYLFRYFLPKAGGRARFVFENEDKAVVNAAIATGRPILLRGEPGTGKTALAEAVQAWMGYELARHVFNADSEIQDLFYSVDHISRLATAQVLGYMVRPSSKIDLGNDQRARDDRVSIEADQIQELLEGHLSIHRFCRPGVLWKSMGPHRQFSRLRSDPQPEVHRSRGHVVLLDEIDKAPPQVPAALLDVLARGTITDPEGHEIEAPADYPRIVFITSNEERSLSDAFLRRCIVRTMTVPDEKEGFYSYMAKRLQVHFPSWFVPEFARQGTTTSDPRFKLCSVVDDCIRRLYELRQRIAKRGDEYLPGCAELIDFVQAIQELTAPIDQGNGGEVPRLERLERKEIEMLMNCFFDKKRVESLGGQSPSNNS